MPVTPNMLLQAAAQAKAQATNANSVAQAAEPGDKAASFAQVYAKQAQNKPAPAADSPVKPARDKVADNAGKKDVVDDKPAADEPVVADSGKTLPADKPAQADDKTDDDAANAAQAPVAVDAGGCGCNN